jgi:hypothetical protein
MRRAYTDDAGLVRKLIDDQPFGIDPDRRKSRSRRSERDAHRAGSKNGTLTSPLIGEFKDGRGELIAQDTFNDRSILVRGVWSEIKPDSPRFEESYSSDGGKTWASAFIASLTRESR